ncbi:MAG: hypothetical protein F6K54_26840 [Okeania sp. SIO3B5]|uniref:hypothetical protein n=1 Tax=Okeania sp. SIO3B5 TaxID=2607811 RepID=UPI001400608A|nr:hypothetical protein [Okeania sp. SIO3B5]NEO56383.1 hypothetical protein [Okeania sp. SIO3B5]
MTVNPLIFISERLKKLRYFGRPNIATLRPLGNVCILYQLGCEVISVTSYQLSVISYQLSVPPTKAGGLKY